MTKRAFFCILVDFCHSDYSANHQKLNIIQNEHFIFWWLRGLFFAFWLTFIAKIAWLIIRSWKESKMSIWIFDDLAGLFFHFGWLLSLRLTQPIIRRLNIIQKWAFHFMMTGDLFLHFGQLSLAKIAWLIIRSWKESKMSIWFFDDLEGLFLHFAVDFCHSDYSANHQKLNIIQKWAFHFMMT